MIYPKKEKKLKALLPQNSIESHYIISRGVSYDVIQNNIYSIRTKSVQLNQHFFIRENEKLKNRLNMKGS